MNLTYGVIAITVTLLTMGGCAAQTDPAEEPDAGGSEGGSGGSASCALAMTLDGHEYIGVGQTWRNPITTDETAFATLPGCNDTGRSDEQDEQVKVHALRDFGLDEAFAWQGMIMIRADLDRPEQVIEWRTPLVCEADGQFEIAGDWVGLPPTQDGSRSIGNPPYPMDVVVTDAPDVFSAEEYESVQFNLRITGTTDPALDNADGKLLTTTGAVFEATVHCEDAKFVADAVTATER